MGTLAEAATRLKQAAGSALPALVLMTDEARLADPLPAAPQRCRRGAPSSSVTTGRRSARRARAGASPPSRAGGASSCWWAKTPRSLERIGAHGVHSAGARHRASRRRALAAGLADHRPPPIPQRRCGPPPPPAWTPLCSRRSSPRRAIRTSVPSVRSRFAALVRHAPIPVYALGGIDRGRAQLLQGSGAVGIAGIGGLIPEGPLRLPRG